METTPRRECDRAVSIDATLCRPNAARFEYRKYSFRRREHGVRELERLLYEQIRARRFFAIGARRAARTSHPRDQYLSGGDEHRDLGGRDRRLAARENDFGGGGRRCGLLRPQPACQRFGREHHAFQRNRKSVMIQHPMIGAFQSEIGVNVIASIIASAFFLAAGFIWGKYKERRRKFGRKD